MPRDYHPRKIIIPIGPSVAYVPLTKGLFCLIDSCELEQVGKWNWFAFKTNLTFEHTYATRTKRVREKTLAIYMHRQLLGAEAGDGKQIDHINGNTLDNRRANLRLVTAHENAANRKMNKSNTSGYRGIHRSKEHGRWKVTVGFHGKYIHGGYYETLEEARSAYEVLAENFFGSIRGVGR